MSFEPKKKEGLFQSLLARFVHKAPVAQTAPSPQAPVAQTAPSPKAPFAPIDPPEEKPKRARVSYEELGIKTLPPHCGWVVNDHHVWSDPSSKDVRWVYLNGYFNPWMQCKLVDMFLQSKGLPGIEGVYKDRKYTLTPEGCPDYRTWGNWRPYMRLRVEPADAEVFAELVAIAEEYFALGYNPGDDVVRELLLKYVPVRREEESRFSGYHDESDTLYDFYNAAGGRIGGYTVRYGEFPDLWAYLQRHTGASQVFGLQVVSPDDYSTETMEETAHTYSEQEKQTVQAFTEAATRGLISLDRPMYFIYNVDDVLFHVHEFLQRKPTEGKLSCFSMLGCFVYSSYSGRENEQVSISLIQAYEQLLSTLAPIKQRILLNTMHARLLQFVEDAHG